MTFTFRKALREQTSTLVGFAGGTGSGKTYSAIRFARGLVGPDGNLCVIDTEAGRALHYADTFAFDHCDFKPPYTPENYLAAIMAAVEKGYGAIVIDSFSHEYNGDGGLQDMHAAELERLATDDQGNVVSWKLDKMNAPAWKKPKLANKRMMSRILQVRSHLVFCLRAEPKIKFVKDDKGRTQIVDAGWQPICEKMFMYEMTASFLMLADAPGIGQPIKLQDQHKSCFPAGQHINEKSGQCLAEWAKGGAGKTEPKTEPKAAGNSAGEPEPRREDPVGAAAQPSDTPERTKAEDDFASAIDGAGSIDELQRVDADIRGSKLDAAARGRLFDRRSKRKAALTQRAAA